MELNQYQEQAKQTDQFGDNESEILHHLLNLTESVGSLSRTIEQEFREDRITEPYRSKLLKRRLGDILWYISIIAQRNSIDLESVATSNLALTRERWSKTNEMRGRHLDEGFPKFEQLPEKMTVAFFDPKDAGGLDRILMCVRLDEGEWVQLGDRIDDNAPREDGYRFHDVLHFAYVAHMGWSPVIRTLLRRKRKSNRDVDRIEDGARATNIEEALTAFIFKHAEGVDFFEHQRSVDFNILKTVVRISSELEVSCRTYNDWELAIFEGYRILRELRAAGEGILRLDCNQEKPSERMTLEPLTREVAAEIGSLVQE